MNNEGKAMYNPQLDTFLAVAEAGSFTKAADRLYISVTAVIKQINLLEGRIGVKLFDRTHRGIRLTKAGEIFFQDTKYLVQYADASVRKIQETARQEELLIRVGTSPMTPSQEIQELWPKVIRYEPDIRFKMVPFENSTENVRNILSNLGDYIDLVAGIYDESMLDQYHCRALRLKDEPILLAVSLQNPLSSKEKLSIDDLNGQKLMLPASGVLSQADAIREEVSKKAPESEIIDFSIYSTEIFNICENEDALLLTIPGWENVHPMLRFIPVAWNYSLTLGLLYSQNPSDAVSRCIAAIKKTMTEEKRNGLSQHPL